MLKWYKMSLCWAQIYCCLNSLIKNWLLSLILSKNVSFCNTQITVKINTFSKAIEILQVSQKAFSFRWLRIFIQDFFTLKGPKNTNLGTLITLQKRQTRNVINLAKRAEKHYEEFKFNSFFSRLLFVTWTSTVFIWTTANLRWITFLIIWE